MTRERDRHFALLVAMMIPVGRRGLWRLSPANASTQARKRAMSDERPIVSEDNQDRVRQGVTGHNVRYVVIVSVALAIIVFIMVAVLARPRAPKRRERTIGERASLQT